MDPNVWGPACWDILFYVAYNTDLSKHTPQIHTLFHLLEVMLPCSHCRRHYAVYKKEVPCVSTIKKHDKLSAFAWLWIIHDMVNQNLGKICMSYEKLLKKHKTLTCIVSDFSILDTVVFMWMSSKKNAKVLEGITIMLTLLENIRPFQICMILKNKINELFSYDVILECRNELLLFYHFQTTTKQYMQECYEHGIS
jgi:hypothetical protein